MSDNNQPVLVSIDDRGVATVTLNNPEKHNAFDDDIIKHLTHAFADLNNNHAVRVVVLASVGKSFSAGADLNWMKRMAQYSYEENRRDASALAKMLRVLNFMHKPTIAKIQGAAFGGAVGLVACCDIAIASQRASFSLSEVKIGLIPATISPYVLDAIGLRACRRYFQTAERFTAEKAYELGLVSEVVADEQLDAECENIVATILLNSPRAVEEAKRLAFEIHTHISDDIIEDTCERIAAIRVSEEGQEGLNAFLEKRSPAWIKE